jgi:hypothetical protein
MDLYGLNKDMLVKLVAEIRDRTLKELSDEELEFELLRRERYRTTLKIKKSLLKLKSVSHLKSLIEKYESAINDIEDFDIFFQNPGILKDFKENNLIRLIFTHSTNSLYKDIYYTLRNENAGYWNWSESDKIEYFSCKCCTNYEILLYFDDKIISKYNIGTRSSYCQNGSSFINNLCSECYNKQFQEKQEREEEIAKYFRHGSNY